jgi:lipopolysaccharide transport system permease protein
VGYVLELGPEPGPASAWFRQLWEHRGVLWILARSDFQVRFKRASLGIIWAVAVPVVQAGVLAVVFSRLSVVRTDRVEHYGVFVLSGVLAWAYWLPAVSAGSTAIVDGNKLTDKVWFPRAVLALVPCLSGCAGLAVSLIVLVVAMPTLGAAPGLDLLLVLPASALLVILTMSVSLVLSALHVYFRDVRFLVQATLILLFYTTPIIYSADDLGALGRWLDLNPLTGAITLFQRASGEGTVHLRALVVSVAFTTVTAVVGCAVQRRHDRLFVDLL